MFKTFAAGLVLFTMMSSVQAVACGAPTPKMVAERQSRLDAQRVVKGEYRPIERIKLTDYWVRDDAQDYEAYAYIGEVTTKRGKTYRVVHIGTEGLIIMCASFYQPAQAAKGKFYVSKQANAAEQLSLSGEEFDGLYPLIHWEGDYLPAAKDAEKSESDAS